TACDAAGHLQVHHAVPQSRTRNKPLHDGFPIAAAQRANNADGRHAAFQTRQMLGHTEGLTAIGGHHVVDPVAENEATVEDRHLGFCVPDVLAVQIDETIVIHVWNHSDA